MLNWNTAANHTDYSIERFALLKLLEGSTSTPYVDGVGDPTIGIGFNLVYNLEPVLRIIVGDQNWNPALYDLLDAVVEKSYSSGQTSSLIANLDKVMRNWHKIDSDVPSTFAFKNDTQIAAALDALAPKYDGYIDDWIAGIPDSSERAALFSMAWNAPGLLGPKLQAAIESGDRAEAWYEIRYNSLGSSLPEGLKAGIANRRYVEADMFDLYHNDARATFAEAVDAGRMLAAHHGSLLGYEAAYDPLAAAIVKGVETIGTIGAELQPAISAVLAKYHLQADRPIEELLATGKGLSKLTGDGTAYDSTGNDDDLLLADKAANQLFGGAGNDTLIGLKGADRLTGGDGDDLFVFTAANDSAAKGKSDIIVDFESGDQLAFTSKGVDFHFLAGRNESFSGVETEIRWLWSGQKTVIEADYDGDGQADLRITMSGRHAMSEADFIL